MLPTGQEGSVFSPRLSHTPVGGPTVACREQGELHSPTLQIPRPETGMAVPGSLSEANLLIASPSRTARPAQLTPSWLEGGPLWHDPANARSQAQLGPTAPSHRKG